VTALHFPDVEPVGPGTPVGRYLRLFWQPVARASDLAPGQAKPVEILGEKFTVYRGAGGAAHVTAFRCAHRGTQMSLGWVEGDDLRCRYHGWKYDAAGQCVEQPNEDRPFCDRVQLRAYPTREYVGLVFAYLGEGAPPPFRTYPDLDRPGVLVADPVETLPCGFWNRLDNDHSHIPWVHRATAQRCNRPDFLVIRHEHLEETEYGWRANRSVKGEPPESRRSLGHAKATHWFMPNVRLFWAPTRTKGFEKRGLWDTKAVWTVPLNDQAHAAFDVTHTPIDDAEAQAFRAARREMDDAAETRWDLAEKILAGEMTPEDLPHDMDAYTSFAIEDYITQVGQGPVASRGRELLAPTDERLIVMRRLWLREVNALVADRPLTDWKIPREPLGANQRATAGAAQ
jgi:5,5'-dehydrodivanillate O-demethylase oxygenase subunit